jgi:MoaA/NifB/PqqE/SkfB family radical SAM enzyme
VTTANLDRYADRARELGATFIQILEPKAIGHYAGQDVTLTPGQQRLLETFCARLNTDPFARHLPTVSYPDWSTRALGCVGAGDRYVYVDTIGDLHGCPFCRTPGIRTLDHDMNTAMSLLQAAGCPAAACACDSTACSAPV